MARVLHIEDDAASRLLVRKILEAAGHVVSDATSGLEGVRVAERERPDIVLVDINVPDLDGYEVTLRLRGTPGMEDTPIVAITAGGEREDSLAVGADGFVQKPIDVTGFPALVARYLAGHSERGDTRAGEALRSRSRKIAERLDDKVGALAETNRRLQEVARLRREFLRSLSHEFATPMTPVVGYLRLLLDEEVGPLTPLQRKCLESIANSTRKLKALIDTLLDVSHLETGRLHVYRRAYDFGEVAERALDESAHLFAERGVVLVRDAIPTGLDAQGDPEKLRRAMTHILDNAVKFTPRGSGVAVGVEVEERGPSPRYRFVVADDGPGIGAADRERILEPFFQADGTPTRAHGGVGLGLAFARHVAEALGGSIAVQSPPASVVAGRKLGGTCVVLSVMATPPVGSEH